jgi:hypothetical protein
LIGSRRANAYAAAAASLVLSCGALALPSLGLAASGGSGLGAQANGGGVTAATNALGVVHPGDVTVAAAGNGITIASRASAMLRTALRFSGNVSPTAAGARVEIERLGRQTKWLWAPTAHATAASDGSFAVVWQTNHIGRFKFRAVIEGAGSSQTAAASPTVVATVYRRAVATQYGPGFYGSNTACGEVLRRHTLGVANRTLPCGTLVAIYYQGRTLVVRVIDRGPYANGADWDLTQATGNALGMAGTATIGAASLPAQQ